MTGKIVLSLKLWLAAWLLLALFAAHGRAQELAEFREFRDDAYAYRFLYPADWKLEPLPEGEKNPAMRVRLRGTAGSSFMVIVEKTGEPLSKREFQADPKADKKIETMMRRTLEQTYHSISKNLGALSMKTGERLNLSDDNAVKFYLASLHTRKTGSPVVVAGTHVYPFFKDYSVNFIMTAFHRGDAVENQVLTAVFNSFRMVEAPTPSK
jgi:hypothetical protein